jgi:hypothetical protein
VLAQWSSWPGNLATWEDGVTLEAAFSSVPAWGQASTQVGKSITTSAPADAVKLTSRAEAEGVEENEAQLRSHKPSEHPSPTGDTLAQNGKHSCPESESQVQDAI